jgi:hypothetical protein
MNPSDPSLTDYPQSLILPGVRLQEALKQGSGVKEAFDTYTRRAYRQPGAAAQASAFLATTFKGDAEQLLQYVSSELLVDELSAGSHVLASIAAEHWDRHNGMDRLTELARALNDSWSDKLNNPEALEFSLALVTAVAILHPDVAAKLLDHCEPACASDPKLSEACTEAREWQHSGELIAQATPDQQRFWHEQLARRGGDWIWDTEEAKQAVRALESANPEAAAKASLLVERVPGWAWNIRVQKPSKAAAVEATRGKPSPVLTVLKWAAAVCIGVGLGALWESAPVREFIAARSATAPAHTESPAIVAAAPSVPAPEVTKVATPAPEPAPAAIASAPAEGPRPVMATLPKPLPESELPLSGKPEAATITAAEPPAVTAQPVPVQKGSLPGRVLSPLGDEFEVTATNAKDDRITDPSGRVWPLPADLAAKPAPASTQPDAPAPAKPLLMAQAAPPAPVEVAPAPPVVPPAPTANPTPSAEQPAAPAPAEKPVVVAPEKPTAPAPQPAAPATADTTKPATTPPAQATTPYKLHPDYFAKPATKPDTAAKKAAVAKPKASPAPEAQSDRVFVTRASSIRLRYRNGIWVSEPGAYLKGAASSPQEWARDMTLREQSSGSIPENYIFQVLNNGVVQVVPDPAKH